MLLTRLVTTIVKEFIFKIKYFSSVITVSEMASTVVLVWNTVFL